MPERTIDGIGMDEWVRGLGREAPLSIELVQALAVWRGINATQAEVAGVVARTRRALRSAAREVSKGWSTHRADTGETVEEEYPTDD